jgi:surface antigen
VKRTSGSAWLQTGGRAAVMALGLGIVAWHTPQAASVSASATSSRPVIPVALAFAASDEQSDRLGSSAPGARVAPTFAAPQPVALGAAPAAASAPQPTARPAAAARRQISHSAVSPAATAPPTPANATTPVNTGNPGVNHFAFGYCTWWVAHKRYVPWFGQAAQWWWAARAFGYAEGRTPRPGAIMVMSGGGSAAVGHVGYVESVNADGSFVISEMNWWGVAGGGWGKVDYRTIRSMVGILGFIY